jgi:hypothetical protein
MRARIVVVIDVSLYVPSRWEGEKEIKNRE